jgi:hypothetical protein
MHVEAPRQSIAESGVGVVTAPATEDERFVVTAYFTRVIKQGRQLWRS